RPAQGHFPFTMSVTTPEVLGSQRTPQAGCRGPQGGRAGAVWTAVRTTYLVFFSSENDKAATLAALQIGPCAKKKATRGAGWLGGGGGGGRVAGAGGGGGGEGRSAPGKRAWTTPAAAGGGGPATARPRSSLPFLIGYITNCNRRARLRPRCIAAAQVTVP